jgi:hypothetical protein
MVKQQPRMDKRRTASASAASGKGRPQRSVNPVPPASHHQWRAGLRSPCAAAHAEDSCASFSPMTGSSLGGLWNFVAIAPGEAHHDGRLERGELLSDGL